MRVPDDPPQMWWAKHLGPESTPLPGWVCVATGSSALRVASLNEVARPFTLPSLLKRRRSKRPIGRLPKHLRAIVGPGSHRTMEKEELHTHTPSSGTWNKPAGLQEGYAGTSATQIPS